MVVPKESIKNAIDLDQLIQGCVEKEKKAPRLVSLFSLFVIGADRPTPALLLVAVGDQSGFTSRAVQGGLE